MKISLKAPPLDLDVEGVEKLDDVLAFVERYFQLELEFETAKAQLRKATKATRAERKPASKR